MKKDSLGRCAECGLFPVKGPDAYADLVAALRNFIRVDDADKHGAALLSQQGQGMDGFSKLANYEQCTRTARATLIDLGLEKEKPNDWAHQEPCPTCGKPMSRSMTRRIRMQNDPVNDDFESGE